ncbi:hypothetical protein IE53DRAFT_69029 [Violaceomyces palustris]|uniref:Uncharacterized protein n=1 Tax=Violaceomyces palustris TaxID=1673888 RepID=A0ACD0NYU0_9BASI|nr:hypothetical protein IE53DRAFT_69029 [Violaceomyces palustris]
MISLTAPTALRRATVTAARSQHTSSSALAARSIHSSSCLRDSHASTSSHSSDSEEYPQEGFSAPFWRNTLLALLAGVGIYRFSDIHSTSHPSKGSSSGLPVPSEKAEEEEEDTRPFLTRYMDYYFTPSSVWKERNLKHLDLARQAAEDKLLFQEAERPPVHRLRYTGSFEQASPHSIPIGGATDLSDLKVKKGSE